MPGARPAAVVDRDVTEALGTRDTSRPRAAAPQPASPPAAPTEPIEGGTVAAPPQQATAIDDRPPRRRARPEPGDVLCGRYVIEKQVAHYGAGHVYCAVDRYREAAGAANPRVALKFPRRSIGDDGETSSLLRQEFVRLSQLRHPHIVDVYDIARDGELEFIVMEWLSGETLADLLARIPTRRIALERAAEIVRGTALALAHAHDLGVVHGDVKPSNIFLAGGRTVKLLDFGSSGGSPGGEAERHWATRAYASPEVLEGRPPQPHDDVFALGVTAYYLFSGERPFGELDALAARERRLTPPPLPDDAFDKWPAIRHALELDPLARTGNARQLLEELEDAPRGAGAEGGRDTRTAFYGAAAVALLASIVWWSADGIDDLPPPAEAALAAADRAYAEGRLVEPREGSALALYSRVLASDPDHPVALAGLTKIAEHFVARAQEAALRGDAAGARAALAQARRADPEHLGIGLVEDLLVARARATLVEAMRLAPTDLERAEALVAEARAVLPADDPGLAGALEQLAQQRTERELGRLLEEIDARILAERLTLPAGDSALDLLRRARELAPDDPRLPLVADRVMTALLFQAMFATSNRDFAAAERFLAMARGMNRPHLALARAEYELARARRAALAGTEGR
jgi:tetratricopeptide (TPR) repeat protein